MAQAEGCLRDAKLNFQASVLSKAFQTGTGSNGLVPDQGVHVRVCIVFHAAVAAWRDSRRTVACPGRLQCNWAIHKKHFPTYIPILDFTHAVSYIFAIAVICFGKTDGAWTAYTNWMTRCWQGKIKEVLVEIKLHQERIGTSPGKAAKDDPREQLRLAIGSPTGYRDVYLELLFPYCFAAQRRSVRSPNLLGFSLTEKEADC